MSRMEKKIICVGEKTGQLEIFLKINKRAGSNNSRGWNISLKINKPVYASISDLRVPNNNAPWLLKLCIFFKLFKLVCRKLICTKMFSLLLQLFILYD